MDDERSLYNIEALRENLAELNRARQHERDLRMQTEALLQGLHIMNAAKDRDTLFDQMIRILQRLVPFDDGLLMIEDNDGYRVVRSNMPGHQNVFWPACSLLRRVTHGETIGLFDVHLSESWRESAPDSLATVKSAILMPIQSETSVAIMVFVHPQRAHFNTDHTRLLRRFTPLINQALTSVEFHEKQKRDQELLQHATLARLKSAEERRRADHEVGRIRDLMSSAISFAPIYLWEIDAAGHYSFIEGSAKVLGIPPEDMLGQMAHQFAHNLDVEDTQHWVNLFAAKEAFTNMVMERRHADGGTIWVSVSGSPFYDDAGGFQGFRGVTTDITEAMRANLKLAEMALHDALTGLANRRKFLDYFESSVARVRRYGVPLSLLALDLDHFKRVNDSYGHPAGDDVLVAVANVLKGMVRKTDLVARFGGEEFMVLLPDTDAAGAYEVAEKIRATLAAEVISAQCNDTRVLLTVTVSIGVSTMLAGPNIPSFDDLVERADQALYAAKINGRNRVCVEPEHLGTNPDGEGDTHDPLS
jgi:diguanylate cyclase (GGDEF)-like protein/PAS domain S-box-containing protein